MESDPEQGAPTPGEPSSEAPKADTPEQGVPSASESPPEAAESSPEQAPALQAPADQAPTDGSPADQTQPAGSAVVLAEGATAPEPEPVGPPRHGPFERALVESREAVPPALAKLFGGEGAALEACAPEAGIAGLLPFTPQEGGLHYGGSFGGLIPLFSPQLSVPARLSALAAVAARLEVLHQAGRVHGDLRPDTIWCGVGGATLVSSARAFDPPALLRARLIAGAHPASLGFADPEVVAGGKASAASDVYSLAALVVWTLSGRVPLGQFDLAPYAAGLGRGLDRLLRKALGPAGEGRPRLEALSDALGGLAQPGAIAASVTAPRPAPAPAPVQVAAKPAVGAVQADFKPAWSEEPRQAPSESQVSGLLMVVLALGGTFVFCGLLWLVLATWVAVGPIGQGLLLLLITLGTAGIGRALEHRTYPRSGLTLLLLATQLIWVNGIHIFTSSGVNPDEKSIGALGLVVSGCSAWLAIRRQSVIAGSLSAIAMSVSAIALAKFLSTGSVHGAMMFTAGVGVSYAALAWAGGRLLPARPSALEVPYAIGGLGWLTISAGAALVVTVSRRGPGALDMAWPYLVVGVIGLGAWRLPPRLATPARIGLALLTILVPIAHAGVAADRGSSVSLLGYAALLALVFVGATLWIGRARNEEPADPAPQEAELQGARAPRGAVTSTREALTQLWGLSAGGWAIVSTFAAIAISADRVGTFDFAWPYLVAIAVGAAAFKLPKRVSTHAWGALAILALVVPIAHAVIAADLGPRYALLGYAALVGLACSLVATLAEVLAVRREASEPTAPLDPRAARKRALLDRTKGHLGPLWASGGLFWFAVSACAALYRWERSGGVGYLVWPYLLALGFVGVSLVAPKRLGRVAVIGASLFLAVLPMAHATAGGLEVPGLLWVVLAGGALLIAAFRWPRIAQDARLQVGVICVGLANVLILPGLACLRKCEGRRGGELFEDALTHAGRVHESDLVFLSIPLGVSLGLVAMGFIFSREAERRWPYRILECAGLLNAFGLLTLLSFGDIQSDFFYIGLLLVGGFTALGVGLYAQRAMLTYVAAPVLLLNLFVHYFAKLTAAGVPWALEAVGFGVALLVLAISYERWVKRYLPRLQDWK